MEVKAESAALLSSLTPRAWEVIELWGLCQTQWTIAGMGGRCGLSYPGVESAARAASIPWDEPHLKLLQAIEIADLNHEAEKEKRKELLKKKTGLGQDDGGWKQLKKGS